jgi:hypothetical protein
MTTKAHGVKGQEPTNASSDQEQQSGGAQLDHLYAQANLGAKRESQFKATGALRSPVFVTPEEDTREGMTEFTLFPTDTPVQRISEGRYQVHGTRTPSGGEGTSFVFDPVIHEGQLPMTLTLLLDDSQLKPLDKK